MARRRIVREEEEDAEEKDTKPAFKPSEFDETEFLQTENRNAKMIYTSLGVALFAGILSFIIMRLTYLLQPDGNTHFMIPIIAPFLLIPIALKLFSKFGIDYKSLDWKKYAENGFMYFATWAAVWVLSMNPPLSDFSDPMIGDFVFAEVDNDGDRIFHYNETPYSVEPAGSLEAFMVITDNYKIERRIFELYLVDDSERDLLIKTEGEDVIDYPEEKYNLTVKKVVSNLTFPLDRDDSEIIEDSDNWFGNNFEDWNGSLWMVRIGDLSQFSSGQEIIYSVYVEDTRGNDHEVEIRIDIEE